MRKLAKVLAVWMAFVLLLTAMATPVLAAEMPPEETAVAESAAEEAAEASEEPAEASEDTDEALPAEEPPAGGTQQEPVPDVVMGDAVEPLGEEEPAKTAGEVETTAAEDVVHDRTIDEVLWMHHTLPHNAFVMYGGITFTQEPSTVAPYAAGAVSEQSLQSALNTLKMVRFLAGVPYENVKLLDEYNNISQHGAVLMAANNELTHYPTQPADMDDAFFAIGYNGCNKANASYSSWNSAGLDYIMLRFISDGGANNMAAAGHRRWQLDPGILNFGTGGAISSTTGATYASVYVYGNNGRRTTPQSYIAWPNAGSMPIEYFTGNAYSTGSNASPAYPWSLTLGSNYTVPSADTFKLTLTRERDEKTWVFDSTTENLGNETYDSVPRDKAHLAVNGREVTFRPDLTTLGAILDGDRFTVLVEGISTGGGAATTLEYTINFFSLAIAGEGWDPQAPKVERVRFAADVMTVEQGKAHQMSPQVWPASAQYVESRWSSSNPEVATISHDGVVTGVSPGSAVISCTINGITATCTVTVIEGAKYIDHPLWIESNAAAVNAKRAAGEPIVAVSYGTQCLNCTYSKPLFTAWMDSYGVPLYGIESYAPNWMAGTGSPTPVIGVSNSLTDYTVFGFADAPQVWQAALADWTGLYDTVEVLTGYGPVNTEALASFESTQEVLDACAAPQSTGTAAEAIAAKSAEIIREAGATTDREKLQALYNWVCTGIYPDLENNFDGASTAAAALESGIANASGYSALLAELCRAAGIPARTLEGYTENLYAHPYYKLEMTAGLVEYAAGKADDWEYLTGLLSRVRNHKWNAVWVDGAWQMLDAALDTGNGLISGGEGATEPVRVVGLPGSDYFLPGAEAFAATHCHWKKDIPLESFSLRPEQVTLGIGEDAIISVTDILPRNTTTPIVPKWEVEGGAVSYEVADSTGLAVKGVSTGSATVTCTMGGITRQCVVTVSEPVQLTNLWIEPDSLEMMTDDQYDLDIGYSPWNATNLELIWSSSNEAVAMVDGTGSVEAVGAGSAVITAEATDGSGLTAECAVNVTQRPPELEGLAISRADATLRTGKTLRLTVSPEPADAAIWGAIEWNSDDPEVAAVDRLAASDRAAIVTGVRSGTTRITASVWDWNTYETFTATCEVTVEAALEKLEIDPACLNADGMLRLEVGDAHALRTRATPEGVAVGQLAWSSSNPLVAQVGPDGTLTALRAGSAAITATTEDGQHEAFCKVTVEAADGAVSFSRKNIMLVRGSAGASLTVNAEPAGAVNLSLYSAATREDVDNIADVLVCTGPGGDGVLQVAPAGGAASGSYILRASLAGRPQVYGECRVDIVDAPGAFETDPLAYAGWGLVNTKVTAYTRRADNTRIELWRGTGGLAVSLGDHACLRFADPAMDELFELRTVDALTAELVFLKREGLRSTYRAELQVEVNDPANPAADPVPLPVGKLEIKVSTKLPGLSAPAVSLNSYYTAQRHRTAEVKVKDWAIARLREEPGRTLTDRGLTWLRVNEDAKTVTVEQGSKKTTTLYLQAQLEGWGSGVDDWISFKLKVTRTNGAPALKLSTTKPSVYVYPGRQDGTPLTLMAKKAGETLASLGVTGVRLADPFAEGTRDAKTYKLQHLYTLDDSGFNTATGALRLHWNDGYDFNDIKGGKLLLLAQTVDGGEIRLPVTVKVLKWSTTVKLKPQKTSVTLNPNLDGGEQIEIPVASNIPGYAMADCLLEATVLADKRWPNEPDVRVEDNVLVVTVDDAVDRKATFKVELMLYDVNGHLMNPNARAVVTVKTHDWDTWPSATLTAKGKADLTTGAPAVLTASFKGYAGAFADGANLRIYRDKQCTDEVTGLFEVTQSGNRFALAPVGTLAKGNYYATVSGSTELGHIVNHSKVVRFTVAATKPKVAAAPKKLVMNRADPASEAMFTITLPYSCRDIAEITLKGQEKDSFPYVVREVGDGRFVLAFDGTKGKAAREGAKSGKVTLQLRMEGNSAPAATLTVQVSVNR